MHALRMRGVDPLVALHSPGPFGAMLDEANIPWFPMHTRRWIGSRQRLYRLLRNRIRDVTTAQRIAGIADGAVLVHSNTLSSPVGAFAAKRMGVPHLWHMREAVDTSSGSTFAYGPKVSARLIDRTTKLVVANSRYLLDQTARYVAAEKLRLLYNGPLDPADAHRALSDRAPLSDKRPLRLLLLGKITARKGQAEALNALALLHRGNFDARLVVAGDGTQRDIASLQALAASIGIAEHVEWAGYVDPTLLYESCDISLLCGPRDPIPRVAVESLAYGIPTVAVRSGGIPEVIDHGETGWLYQEGSPESLAKGIVEATTTAPAVLREMREEGRRRVYARFNSQRYGDEALTLYRELGVRA